MRCWTGVLQALDDAPPGRRRGLPRQIPVPIRQPAAQEVLLARTEIIHRKAQRVRHGVEAPLCELRHHVDLQHLVFVMELERREVGVDEAAPILAQVDGHGGPEHRQPLVEADDLLLVQPQQGAVQEPLGILDPGLQLQVGTECVQQLAECGLGQQIRAPAAGRQAVEQMIQQAPRGTAAALRGLRKRLPITLEGHPYRLRVPPVQPQAALAALLAAAVPGDAAERAPYALRQDADGIVAGLLEGVLEALGGDAQMEGRGVALAHVRGRFLQSGDQGAFQRRRLLEALARGTHHPGVYERSEHGVVAGDAQPLQVVHGAAHAFRAQSGDHHQLVGGDAFVRVRVDQGLGDGQ